MSTNKLARLAAVLAVASVSGLFAAAAEARQAQTTADLNLRTGPGTQYAIIATMPAGSRIDIGDCADGWCAVDWRGQDGYASMVGLTGGPVGPAPEVIVIDPPYPYRAGHYRSTNVYRELPPYAAVPPRFYPRRFILSPRERNRYRYRPHIFGPAGDAEAGYMK
ncbi:SH3 domain-containing protein [Methyloligella halotolerans]|uniref:SH3 domain-containing protein n=1 Tax=Methyloligella halotolerans TaxID=1177755 RepID=UPI001471CB92|nr:SH3 domain-containing protein [Methyloligella halotolerans]